MEIRNCLTVNEVAKIMGKSAQWVRVAVQYGKIPGVCFKMPNSSKFSYLFTTKEIEQYLGIKINDDSNEKKSV